MKPGKKIILTIAMGIALSPHNAIPEDLNVENCRNCTIINGKRIDTSKPFQRIYDRVRKYRTHHDAIQFAEALSTKRLWKELTAIAEIESTFNKEAIGKKDKDDIGAFQVNRRYHGNVPKHLSGQADQSERILEDLISSRNNKRNSIRCYNGSLQNPETYVYAMKVEKVMREI